MLMKLKDIFRKYFFYSFKSTINTLYLPIIFIFIMTTGWVSSIIATTQIEENAYKNINDTIFQTKNYLNYMLSDTFEQLVSLANDPKILSLMVTEKSEIKPEAYIELDKNLGFIYSHYDTILESILVDLNRGNFLLYRSNYYSNPTVSFKEFSKYSGNNEGFYWENLHPDRIFDKNHKTISMFRLIETHGYPSKGIVLFNLREDFFEKVLNKSLIGKNGYLALISPDGEFESKTVKKEYRLDDHTLHSIQKLKKESGQFSYKSALGEDMIVIYDTIDINKWKLAAVVPKSEILNKVGYIQKFTILITMLLAVFAIFLTNIVGKFISRPLNQMAKQMRNFNQENLDFEYKSSGPEEMKILHTGFKDLTIRIHTLMEQIRFDQEEKRQLEFAVMHAQINPHFLYNTLYSIKGLCDMGLNKDASQMITALSSFFRIGISKGKEIITIKEEIEHIQHYLFIQEMRYGDDFSYEIDVDQEVLPYNIIKLSLQPLIENAIYHGVKQKRGQGKIVVRGYQVEETIVLEVADNGHGIDEEKLKDILNEMEDSFQKKKKHIGIGLQSVNERIKIHFGADYGLTIESEPGSGTTVRIYIPKRKGDSQEYA